MSSDSVYQYDDDYSKFLEQSCEKHNNQLKIEQLQRKIYALELEIQSIFIESHGKYGRNIKLESYLEDDLK